MKKMVLILTVVCLLGTMVAVAQADWYNAYITSVGMGSSSYFIYLTDRATNPAFTNRQFIMAAANGNKYLATALTAVSTGQYVRVYFPVAGTPAAGALITAVFLQAQ